MTRTYRACASSYIILSVPFALIAGIELWTAKSADLLLAAVLALQLFIYLWLLRFKLTITPNSLTYSTLFAARQTIDLSEITNADIVVEGYGAYQRHLLEITTRWLSIRVHLKIFSREAVKDLFQTIKAASPGAPPQASQHRRYHARLAGGISVVLL